MTGWKFRSMARRSIERYQQLQFGLEADSVAREILSSLPLLEGLPSPTTWVVKRVVSVDAARAVVAVGPQTIREPVAVFKLSRDANAAKNMNREKDALTALAVDERLDELLPLFPRVLASGTIGRGAFVVERALPGIDARLILSDPRRGARVLKAAVETVGLLHQRTARTATVDKGLIQKWIDEPLRLIRGLGDVHSGIAANSAAAERLGATLSDGLIGRRLAVSWVHGDFFPGNILVSADGGAVTGLVDWDLAAPDDLPLLDVVQFLVGSHLARGRSELGRVVRGLLNGSGFRTDELRVLATSQANLGGDGLSTRELVLLTWLRHVRCNLTKTSYFARHRWWVRENVEGVLESLPK
jgi:aminoglycoside phosphotransferase (APT) family kinase protein